MTIGDLKIPPKAEHLLSKLSKNAHLLPSMPRLHMY